MNNQFLLNLELLFSDLKEFIIVVDKFGKILNLNNTAIDILAFDKLEIIDKQISDICCDKTIECAIKSNIYSFSTNLRTKYKQLIPIKGKADVVNYKSEKYIILKLQKTEEVLKDTNSNKKNDLGYTHFIKDISGKYVYINDSFERYFKKSRDEVIHKYDADIWDKDFSYKCRREDLYVISTKNTYTSYNSKIIDDQLFYYEISKSPIVDENNKVTCVFGITRDITESVKLRNELVVQNEQLSIIYKILNNSYTNLNVKALFGSLYRDFKTLLNVDSVCVHLYNFNSKKLEYCTSNGISQSFLESYIKSDIGIAYMHEIFNSKVPVRMTSVNKLSDDDKKKFAIIEGLFYCASYPLVYNDICFGVINFGCKSEDYSYNWDDNFMDAICKNISILLQNALLYNQLEENLKLEKESREQIDLYFNTTIDFFCIVDEHYCIKKVSRHMFETLGYEENEMMFTSMEKYIHANDKKIAFNRISSFDGSTSIEVLSRVLCKNGKYITVDWNVKHLKDRGIYICSGRDITYKIEIEQNKKKIEESLHLEKLKNEFLSSISHELRTPISVIYGAIHIIETNLMAYNYYEHSHNNYMPMSEHIKSIKKNTFRLLRLFNNILDITNVDAGFTNLNLETHNVVKVFEDISLSISDHLVSRGINLIFDTDMEEEYADIDVDKMERVMLNLISNSVKYSNKNKDTEIIVRVYEKNSHACISVKDNGIGISSEYLPIIFDRFTQSRECMTRSTEGSGIGLYLVKILLQMQGANISVNSVQGKGSEFIIEIPIIADFDCSNIDYNIEEDFSVKIENFDLEFSDIVLLNY